MKRLFPYSLFLYLKIMALEISGKIIKVLPEQNGTGRNGAWKKQDFIVETKEQYPKKICITAWGDKVNALSQIPMQSDVKVSVNMVISQNVCIFYFF